MLLSRFTLRPWFCRLPPSQFDFWYCQYSPTCDLQPHQLQPVTQQENTLSYEKTPFILLRNPIERLGDRLCESPLKSNATEVDSWGNVCLWPIRPVLISGFNRMKPQVRVILPLLDRTRGWSVTRSPHSPGISVAEQLASRLTQTQGLKVNQGIIFSRIKMFFTPNVLCSLSLLKLKTERQTTYTENLTAKLRNWYQNFR